MKLISSYRHLRQLGFTLIELIIVLIIIGVLAAIAVPQFLDLAGDADRKALDATAASVNSALSIKYGKDKLSGATSITACTGVADAVQSTYAGGSIVNPPLTVAATAYAIADLSAGKTCKLTKAGVYKSGSTTELYEATIIIPQ